MEVVVTEGTWEKRRCMVKVDAGEGLPRAHIVAAPRVPFPDSKKSLSCYAFSLNNIVYIAPLK